MRHVPAAAKCSDWFDTFFLSGFTTELGEIELVSESASIAGASLCK